jgi:putative addiction module component (TIGR02574 family)
MNERVKKLSEEIRRLAPDEQADLMDELLVLAIRDPDPSVEQAWAAEAERRLDAWERGETDAVPAEDVIDRLRSRFPR